MERLHQMKVIPDILPDFHPSLDLRATATTSLKEYSKTKKRYTDVEPGMFLMPEQVCSPFALYSMLNFM
jgi:large subunit ribosomal protein L35